MVIVFEDAGWSELTPLTHWRCVWDLRCGAATLAEKIRRRYRGAELGFWGREWLAAAQAARGHPINAPVTDSERNNDRPLLLLNGRAIFDSAVPITGPAEVGLAGSDGTGDPATVTVLWWRLPPNQRGRLTPRDLLDGRLTAQRLAELRPTPVRAQARLLNRPWDLVAANPAEIAADFSAGYFGTPAEPPAMSSHAGVYVLNPAGVYIAGSACVKPTVVLDAEAGPILIGPDAVIHPHTTVQGPAVIGVGSLVQPGSVIRTGTAVGPVCKVGGELEETILLGFANKQHDGFLGHSIVGEWCNLGAGTVSSDLKNTYGRVRVEWPEWTPSAVDTGRMFLGVTMGDHTKTSIGTRLPTGAVIGVGCQILLSRTAPKTLPHLTWLDDEGPHPVEPTKAIEIASRMMARRRRALHAAEAELLTRLSR